MRVNFSGSEPSPLWSVSCVVNQKCFHDIVLMYVSSGNPSSPVQHLLPSKEGDGEVGGGFRMGNTCTPMVDSCQSMQNHYNIVK